MTLSGKTYVVTGAASGIGAAAAVRLRDAGASVVGVDRHVDEDFDGLFIQADLSTNQGVVEAASKFPDIFDGLVNNAGVPGTAPWGTVLSVNALALRDLSRAALSRIRKGGVIVNLASGVADFWRDNSELVRAFAGTDDWASALNQVRDVPEVVANSYRFSKECVRWLTVQGAVANLGRVRFVSLSPGPVDTPIFEDFKRDHGTERVAQAVAMVGRAGKPEDIAAAICFLVSSDAEWVNGADIAVDGGLSAYRTSESIESELDLSAT